MQNITFWRATIAHLSRLSQSLHFRPFNKIVYACKTSFPNKSRALSKFVIDIISRVFKRGSITYTFHYITSLQSLSYASILLLYIRHSSSSFITLYDFQYILCLQNKYQCCLQKTLKEKYHARKFMSPITN